MFQKGESLQVSFPFHHPIYSFPLQRNNDEVHSSYPFLPSLRSQPYHNISKERKGQITRKSGIGFIKASDGIMDKK